MLSGERTLHAPARQPQTRARRAEQRERVAPTHEAVPCARCGENTGHADILFHDEGQICLTCYGEVSVDEHAGRRARAAAPWSSAGASLLFAALFWVPLAGPAFLLLAWVFALHATREGVRGAVALRGQGARAREQLLAALGAVAGLGALGAAALATWSLLAVIQAYGVSYGW